VRPTPRHDLLPTGAQALEFEFAAATLARVKLSNDHIVVNQSVGGSHLPRPINKIRRFRNIGSGN